jgi:fimbrial chaperone protein
LPALAGSFMVTPVRVTLSPAQPIVALTVRNDSNDSTVVQVDLTAWSQAEGKDIHAPTRDVIATPPLFTMPAGGTQVVRVGLRRSPDAERELTYRLFLQEVPPPPKVEFKGLRVALRMSIPVFVPPPQAVAPALEWHAVREPQGWLNVSVRNGGKAHVHIADFRLEHVDGKEIARLSSSDYVLPGQRHEWRLRGEAAPGQLLRVLAGTDAGAMRAEIPVDSR